MARLHTNMHKALNEEMLKKLRTINVTTNIDFLQQDADGLEKLVKLARKDVIEIKEQIMDTFSYNVRSGKDLLQFEEKNVITTGIQRLDKLLNGGFHSGELYEFCGMSSCGKTQLSLNLAINVILSTDGIVHYVDTKRDFSGSRVQMILEAKGHNDEETARVMNQIRITRVDNVYELLSVLYHLTKLLKQSDIEKSTRLVIIDSLPAIIHALSDKADSLCFLYHIAGVIRYISNEFHVSVITINLETQWRDVDGFNSKTVETPAVVKPVLGKFWLNVPTTRLRIQCLKNEERLITVWKSIGLKNGTSCHLNLSDAGFT